MTVKEAYKTIQDMGYAVKHKRASQTILDRLENNIKTLREAEVTFNDLYKKKERNNSDLLIRINELIETIEQYEEKIKLYEKYGEYLEAIIRVCLKAKQWTYNEWYAVYKQSKE